MNFKRKEESLINLAKIRINEQINDSPVRLIDVNGNQLGVVPVEEAQEEAVKSGLDLVEVSPDTKPPVCRIMNFGKYKYEISQKAKKARKNRTIVHIKEIKMRSEISEHDFNFKIRHAEQFLKRGNKVKFTLVFRGREILHKEIGEKVLNRIIELLKDIAVIESPIRNDGNNLSMIIVSKQ